MPKVPVGGKPLLATWATQELHRPPPTAGASHAPPGASCWNPGLLLDPLNRASCCCPRGAGSTWHCAQEAPVASSSPFL
eukprot:13497945-Alexandrium_andersonii.AAC.1